jgi:diguanylate cyclase (GGDEF)-like protein
VLVSEPSMPGLKVLTERIRAAVEQEKIRFEDQQVLVTVSLGAALAIPGRDEDDDFKAKLIAVADQAMYESKKAGRNRCCVRSTLPGVAEVAQPTTGAAPRSVTEVLSP